MGAVLATFLTASIDFFSSALAALRAPFQEHPCRKCGCKNYTDEELFIWLREQSRLIEYPQIVLSSGHLDKPLKCSNCKHGRSHHGSLEPRLLTTDMLPCGGQVHVEKQARLQKNRRASRFDGQNVSVGDADEAQQQLDSELATQTTTTPALKQLKTTDVVIGDGAELKPGMELALHYDAYTRLSMEKFESSRDGPAFRMTVGRGDVVKGLDDGVVGMRVGGRRRIEIPAHLAFGTAKVLGEREVDVVFDVRVQAVHSN